ncbi:MAG: extracellular solute-binding protein [Oscillospiraceae bacterium]|nr:extracellular solute-binding protein [Oscillospiraceae bacterium]
MKRAIALLLILTLVFTTFLTGCGKNTPADSDNGQDLSAQPAPTPQLAAFPKLSDTIPNIDNIVLTKDKIYFTSTEAYPDRSFYLGTAIYSVNIDGSDLTELKNYTETYDPPSEALGGETIIVSMHADDNGNVWIAEAAYYYVFALLNDANLESSPISQIWDYKASVGSEYAVRKLDATGSEVHALDLNVPEAMHEGYYVESIACDGDGNLYVGSVMGISVFDREGNSLFDLVFSGHYRRLIKLHDGTVAVPNSGEMLHIIDFENKAWDKPISLPERAYNIFSGNEEYSVVFIDGVKLHGIKTGTQEVEIILDFGENNINPKIVDNLLFLPDGRIMLTNRALSASDNETELLVFSIIPPGFLSEQGIIELTFAVSDPGDSNGIREAVMQFNSESTTHRIEIIDYTDYSGNWHVPVERLAMELITGTAPDIIRVHSVPYEQWAAKGVFVDLYPYIDADRELSRSDFLESIFACAEVNGGLYGVPTSFSIASLVGNPSVIGDSTSWTWSEFMSVINANPKADYPVGGEMREEYGLRYWLQSTIGNYVDWVSGTAHFDRGDFAELLELFKDYTAYDYDNYQSTQQLVASGRQLMGQSRLYTFMYYHWNREEYGGEFIFKGYPTENGSGIYAAGGTDVMINAQGKDVDAAWEFVRTFLTEDWQRTRPGNHFMFPTNKNVFNEKLKEAMTPPEEEQWITPYMGTPFMVNAALTQKEADQIVAAVNAISGFTGFSTPSLEDIIMESAADYFAGRITVEDAVRIIQSRASIYMAEQAG